MRRGLGTTIFKTKRFGLYSLLPQTKQTQKHGSNNLKDLEYIDNIKNFVTNQLGNLINKGKSCP